MKYTNVLSFGGGRQTFYLLFKYWRRYKDGYVVHADVGNGDREHAEHQITYDLIDNLAKPFCKEKGIKFVTVSADIGLWQKCVERKIVPVPHPRWCTREHKIDPVKRFYRKELNAHYKKHIIVQDIGFSLDEVNRANFSVEGPKYIKTEYPLLDDKIRGQDCIDWLDQNYPQIDWKNAKSSCWFCPFAKKSALFQLTDKQKQDMIDLEENCKVPEWKFRSKPLKMYLHKDSHTLGKYDPELLASYEKEEDAGCDSGHCFL